MIIYFDRIDKQLTTEWDSPKVVNTEKLSDEYKHAMSTAGSANKKLLKSIKDPNMQKYSQNRRLISIFNINLIY